VSPSVFQGLHPRLLEAMQELGIEEPTPPQLEAIPVVRQGLNTLIVAPTDSGKTEAALLPILDAIIGEPSTGIQLLYITPLRALNRDIFRRLEGLGEAVGVRVDVRHGDTPQSRRRRQASNPPQVLVTTPETFQAILVSKSMRERLSGVRWVVVDEAHELAASKRGAQLSVGLERLEALTGGRVQRIGLSATVGDPWALSSLLGGPHTVEVVQVGAGKRYSYQVAFPRVEERDFDVADDLGTSPQAAARLRAIKELVEAHTSSLVFVQGRGQAEALGHRLKQMGVSVEVHHGSLSRGERRGVEERLKRGEVRAVVCTSTLQLGIDVGSVDLCIQYQSPRQATALIQRVGRAGHTLGEVSRGILVATHNEDALECLTLKQMAEEGQAERVEAPEAPLDVLAHQLVGLTLESGEVETSRAYQLVKKAHPYRSLSWEEFQEVASFLDALGLIAVEEDRLRKRGRGRRYYYENLGMMNDERRYPFINAATDETIATVGDEFWNLRAREGLNVILKGRVWRILHIDEKHGALYALPSTDPLGAAPGWDGELIPVPREVAQESSALRCRLVEAGDLEEAQKLGLDPETATEIREEALRYLESGLPLPGPRNLVLEAWDRYLVIHSPRGENTNRTLGAILDVALTPHNLVYSWWNDAYRVLVEAPQRLTEYDLEKAKQVVEGLNPAEAQRLLQEFLEARFPFGYKMKFVAERFGVIPRGKTMGYRQMENLYHRYRDTPVYKETLKEAYRDKLDLDGVQRLLEGIAQGVVGVAAKKVSQPTPLAKHILEQYGELEELMATDLAVEDQLQYMAKAVKSRRVTLACLDCGQWETTARVGQLEEHPKCNLCGSGLLAVLPRRTRGREFLALLERWRRGEELAGEEAETLRRGRKTADLVLSHGRRAVEALVVYGVGPVTSFQVLSRMHRDEESFYRDLLRAKIRYMRTRQYWDEREEA